MKKLLLIIALYFLSQTIVLCQEKITLEEFIAFSQFKSNVDFTNFNNIYQYTLYQSNLAKDYIYDESGLIKETTLKKFSHLTTGDSILYTKYHKIFRDMRKTNDYKSYLGFYKKKGNTTIQFASSSHVAGYDYLDLLLEESREKGFVTKKPDTTYNENTMIIHYESKKDVYILN